jgi:hypothetical protein
MTLRPGRMTSRRPRRPRLDRGHQQLHGGGHELLVHAGSVVGRQHGQPEQGREHDDGQLLRVGVASNPAQSLLGCEVPGDEVGWPHRPSRGKRRPHLTTLASQLRVGQQRELER